MNTIEQAQPFPTVSQHLKSMHAASAELSRLNSACQMLMSALENSQTMLAGMLNDRSFSRQAIEIQVQDNRFALDIVRRD